MDFDLTSFDLLPKTPTSNKITSSQGATTSPQNILFISFINVIDVPE